jgi:hypothetical protein
MNQKTIIFISFLLISIISCAQSKYGIRKVDAFFSEHLPGNIPVDSDGNSLYPGPDTINTIYLETKGVSIKWIAAWKNGKSFSVVTTAIEETPFEAGVNKLSDKKIILKPAAGNKLWLLQLVKDETPSKSPVKAKPGEIILKGKSGKNTIIQKINSQTELASLPSV